MVYNYIYIVNMSISRYLQNSDFHIYTTILKTNSKVYTIYDYKSKYMYITIFKENLYKISKLMNIFLYNIFLI